MALGAPHPRYLQEQLSSTELVEWQAYYRIEPWGFPERSWRWGILAYTVAQFGFKKLRPGVRWTDFYRRRESAPDAKTLSQQILAGFDALKAKRGQRG